MRLAPIRLLLVLLVCGLGLAAGPARAQDEPAADESDLATMSLEEVSRKLENPLTDLWSLTLQDNLALVEGDDFRHAEVQNTFLFQPFMPFAIGPDREYMFTLRPVFPLVTNPVLDPSTSRGTDGHKTGLGDIQLLALAGPNQQSGAVWGLGATFRFPTATSDALGQEKWQAGPAAMYFWLGKPWVAGVLAQHWWSFAGDDDRDSVSQTDIQYVIRRSLPGGWSLGMGPTLSIDWKADSGNRVTLPIGLGITKTVRWGKTPIKLRFEPQYSIIRPDDFGVVWNFRIQITPVIPNPFR